MMKHIIILILLTTVGCSTDIDLPTLSSPSPAPGLEQTSGGAEAAQLWISKNAPRGMGDYQIKQFLLAFSIPLRPICWYMTDDMNWERELGPIATFEELQLLSAADVTLSYEPDENSMSQFQLDALTFLRDLNAGRHTL